MIIFLVANPVMTACIWALLYLFDYGMTLWFSRLYKQYLSQHFVYEGGVELNPVFEEDIAGLHSGNLRFLVLLGLVMAVLILFGWVGPIIGDFEFLAGAALLLWVFIDLQHLRNLYLYFHLRCRPEAIKGRIKQSYWLNQRLVAYDAFVFGVIYGLAWLADEKQFLLGGAFACFNLAVWHYFLASRQAEKLINLVTSRQRL